MTAALANFPLATSMAPKGLELSEDLASEGYESEEYDEMDELSDSPSSRTSLSRPTTPPDSTVHTSTRLRSATTSSPPSDHFTLAVKAERILGLTPGTLAHARACLENARDEVKRLSLEPTPPPVDYATYQTSFSDGEKDKDKGLRGRFDRAKKVMSVALPSHGRMPSVVVGTGGKRGGREAREEETSCRWGDSLAKDGGEAGKGAGDS